MHNLTIRKVTIADINKLQSVSRQTFFETFAEVNTAANMQKYLDENLSLERLQAELNNPESEFYFASNNEQIVGYLKINVGQAQNELQDNNALELERIYVLKEYQGSGVGQVLFDIAIQVARRRRSEFLWLGVWEKNFKALKFYERFGFIEFDKHIFLLGDDIQTDIMMKLLLKD
jgi:ribosomal protein S18 acetylase RimI-like enzyme